MTQLNFKWKLRHALLAITLLIPGAVLAVTFDEALREVEQARSNYAMAAGDLDVLRQADGELQKARQTLDHVDKLLNQRADEDEILHHAYLANQQVEIARETAALKWAEKWAEIQRDRATDMKARRAEKARANAEQAAEAARERARQAEFARFEAEKRADRAEISRDVAKTRAKAAELKSSIQPKGNDRFAERYEYIPADGKGYFERYEEVRETTTWR